MSSRLYFKYCILPSSKNGRTTPTWRSRLSSSTNPHPLPSSSSSTCSPPSAPSLLLSSSRLPVTVVTRVHCFFRRFLEKPWISWDSECIVGQQSSQESAARKQRLLVDTIVWTEQDDRYVYIHSYGYIYVKLTTTISVFVTQFQGQTCISLILWCI